MILDYLLRVAILLPLIGGLVWVALRVIKNGGLAGQLGQLGQRQRGVLSTVEVLPLGVSGRLAVVRFHGRDLLIATTRQGVTLLADHPVADDA